MMQSSGERLRPKSRGGNTDALTLSPGLQALPYEASQIDAYELPVIVRAQLDATDSGAWRVIEACECIPRAQLEMRLLHATATMHKRHSP